MAWCEFTSSSSSKVYVIMTGSSNTNVRTYPDVNGVVTCSHEFPVFRDETLEFSRAVEIFETKDCFRGVPFNYIPDDYSEMTTLLTALGVEGGISCMIAERLRIDNNVLERSAGPYFIMTMVLNSLLRFTFRYRSSPSPLSDERITGVGCLLVGYLVWTSITSRNLELNIKALSCIRNYFPFSWETLNTHRGYMLRYSFTGKYSSHKNLHLDKKMAMIGQIIRLFIRMYPENKGHPNEALINKMYQDFNVGLNMFLIESITDLPDFLDHNTELSFTGETFRLPIVDDREEIVVYRD